MFFVLETVYMAMVIPYVGGGVSAVAVLPRPFRPQYVSTVGTFLEAKPGPLELVLCF